MQYKKKDIIDKLLDSGREEFVLYGYNGANIRNIAKRAGITVSNFYRYFDGKNSLLETLLEPAYTETFKTIEFLAKYENTIHNFTLSIAAPFFIDKLLDLFEIHGKELLILFDKCESTRYDDFSKKIIAMVEYVIADKLFGNPSESDVHFSGIIAQAFIGSVFATLKQSGSRQLMGEMLSRVLIFYFGFLDGRV